MEKIVSQKIKVDIGDDLSLFDRFCFWFATIDIMFLPYFKYISVSFSVPLIFLWTMLNSKSLFRDKEAIAVSFISFSMLLSTIVGLVYYGDVRFETTFLTSVKRFFQYNICFGYYFFYKSYFKRKNVNIAKIIFIFLIYTTFFAIAYKLLPYEYAVLKIAINPADNHTRRYLAGIVNYRFNYLWTDPNNIAYLIDGLVYWYLLRNECSIISKIVFILLSIFIVTATVSNGGMIILGFMFLVLIICQLISNAKLNLNKLISIYLLLIIGFNIILFTKIGNKIYEVLFQQFETRLIYYFKSQNISGGRIADLKVAINDLNPIFFIIGSGKEGFTSENGHLYWICMYGFLSYLILLWFMFRKYKTQLWKDYLWILPFFVAFTMNIAIGEFKWMAIYFILLAYSRYGINIKERIINYDTNTKV